MLTATQKALGIRYATEEENAIYDKVEAAYERLTEAEGDALFDLLCEEEELFRNKIKSKMLKAMIRSMGLTVKEVCTWYYME
jgi:succinate dehydrogenase flavin-adding protein (antitoxin of CptAB toxin-antitoxin module)